ncbi:MAG: nucleotidyltransferase domain-containing protein [Candidatus Rokuibacteriota bacterium]
MTKLARLSEILGREQLAEREPEFERLGETALWQVEQDLELLARRVPWSEVCRAYRDLLRNAGQFVHAMYEIRVAAMLAPVATELQLHPKVGNGACDLRCRLCSYDLFVEVRTREDVFPWDRVEWNEMRRTGEGVDTDVRERATTQTTTDLHDLIAHKDSQLPDGQMGIVVVGSRGGHWIDVEAALFGDEVDRASRSGSVWRERQGHGLYGQRARPSAVVWLKLRPSFGDVRVHSRLFLNPLANHPITGEIAETLFGVFDRWRVLTQEVDRIRKILVDRYQPERVILFGSLAHSSGKEVHSASDIDLFVVKRTSARYTDRVGGVLDLVQSRVGLNVIVYTPEELAAAEREDNFFVRDEILGRGCVLFP